MSAGDASVVLYKVYHSDVAPFILFIHSLSSTSKKKERKSMSSHREKYAHLVGKHVDEATEALKSDGMLHVNDKFFFSVVKYFRFGTTCLPSHGPHSKRKS